MTDKNFADGMIIKRSGEYFLKVGIKREEFITWLNSLPESKGWVNCTIAQIREPKEGKSTHYMEEDTWKPDSAKKAASSDIKEDNDDLPF